MIIIHSNGSKWAGEAPDPIEKLFEVLATHTLDPTFEHKNGSFFVENPRAGVTVGRGLYQDAGLLYPNQNVIRFFGNFFEVSHCFRIDIDTDEEPELSAQLKAAIEANQATTAYQQARVNCGLVKLTEDSK